MTKRVSNRKGKGGARSCRTWGVHMSRLSLASGPTGNPVVPAAPVYRGRQVKRPPFMRRVIHKVKRFFSRPKGR